MRRPLAVLAACLAVAVGVPLAWWATRPAPSVGAPVTSVGVVAGTSADGASPAPSASTPAPAAPDPAGTTSPAGLPTLRARPATPPPAPGPGPTPVRLRMPALDVDARVEGVGVTARGDVVVPALAREVGWYRYSSTPGAPEGAVVVVGHVDTKAQGPGALFRLREASVGDRIVLTRSDGRDVAYRVVGRETFVKKRLPVERLFARDGSPRLVLVTCGGPFVRELSSYRDNVVVAAEPVA